MMKKLIILLLSISLYSQIFCNPVTIKIGVLAEGEFARDSAQAAIDFLTQPPSSSNISEWTVEDYERQEVINYFFPAGMIKFEIEFKLLSGEVNDPEIIANMTRSLYESGCTAVLGPSFSEQAVIASKVATEFKRPLIGFSASSEELSDRTVHPYFFRTIPSDSAQVEFMMDSIYLLDFSHEFALLYEGSSYGRNALQHMADYAPVKLLKLLYSAEVNDDTAIAPILSEIKSRNISVIVCFMADYTTIERTVLAARSSRLLQLPYVWIFSEAFTSGLQIIDNEVTPTEYYPAFQAEGSVPSGIFYTLITTGVWRNDRYFLQKVPNPPVYASLAFDAAILAVISIKVLASQGGDLNDGAGIINTAAKAKFLGASGRVAFSKNKERIGSDYILQNLYLNDEQKTVQQAIYRWSQEEESKVLRPTIDLYGYSYDIRANPFPLMDKWSSGRTAPEARYAANYGVDLQGSQLLVFGGTDNEQYFANTWMYSFITLQWTQYFSVPGSSPPARVEAASIVIDDNFYVHGGFDGKAFLKDVWRMDITTGEWTELTSVISAFDGPPARSMISFVQIGRKLYTFGGFSYGGYTNEIWVLNLDIPRWELISVSSAAPTQRGSACAFAYSHYFGIFGGRTADSSINDLWLFDIRTNTWHEVSQQNIPHDRQNHRCAVVGTDLYVGGGFSEESSLLVDDFLKTALPANVSNPTVVWEFLEKGSMHAQEANRFLVVGNNLVWFGGWGEEAGINSLFTYNVQEKVAIQVHGSAGSLTGVVEGCSCVVGQEVFVFGGRSVKGGYSPHLMVYFADRNIFERVIPTSTTMPTARVGCMLIAAGTTLYLFGGLGSDGLYLQDLWSYTRITGEWAKVSVTGNIPSPRSYMGYASFQSETQAVMYGGRDMLNQLGEIWILDLNYMQWQQIQPLADHGRSVAVVSPSVVLMNSDADMWVAGGATLVDDPQYTIMKFSFESRTWELVTEYPSNYLGKAGATLTAISETKLVLFGGAYYWDLPKTTYLLDTERKSLSEIHFTQEINLPPSRLKHIAMYYGNTLVVLFGEGQLPDTAVRTDIVIYSDVWRISLYPFCSLEEQKKHYTGIVGSCISCGEGTYELDGVCTPCGPGTYNDEIGAKACLPCPAGFYNPHSGATSSKWCTPCPFNTYAPKTGMDQCYPCPEGTTCYIGSTNANSAKPYQPTSFSIVPPPTFEADAARQVYTTVGVFGSAGVISAIFVLTLFTIAKLSARCNRLLSSFDIFFSERHQRGLGVLEVQRTRLGGIFTFLLIFFLTAFVINLVVPLAIDNISERRTLTPIVAAPAVDVYSRLEITITITGRVEHCEHNGVKSSTFVQCHSSVITTFDGVSTKNPSTKRYTQCKANTGAPGCIVQIVCETCTYRKHSYIEVVFSDTSSARAYSIDVQSTTGITGNDKDLPSKAHGEIHCEETKLFRGKAVPTTVYLDLLSTFFTIPSADVSNTGYHMEITNIQHGDQVDIYQYGQRTGFALKFDMLVESAALQVERYQKKEIQAVILEILSSVVGIMGATGTIMFYTEIALENVIPMILNILLIKVFKVKSKTETTASEDQQSSSQEGEVHAAQEGSQPQAERNELGEMVHRKSVVEEVKLSLPTPTKRQKEQFVSSFWDAGLPTGDDLVL